MNDSFGKANGHGDGWGQGASTNEEFFVEDCGRTIGGICFACGSADGVFGCEIRESAHGDGNGKGDGSDAFYDDYP